jgi:hypothetical protein
MTRKQDRDRISSHDEPGQRVNQKSRFQGPVDLDSFHRLGSPQKVDELQMSGTVPHDFESAPWVAPVRSAASAMIQSLERLRERVLERLDSIEALSRQQAALAPAASESLAQALEQKRAELEETERRLSAQAERQQKAWSESLAQLEADRRTLAEAWARIERERVMYSRASEPVHQCHAQGPGLRPVSSDTVPHANALVLAPSATADSDASHPVSQAILRQFQALCNDVRRNAEERRESS